MLGFKVLMVDDKDEFGRAWRIRSWYVDGNWSVDQWTEGKCFCYPDAIAASNKSIFVNHWPFPPDEKDVSEKIMLSGCGIYVVTTFDLAWSWVGLIHTSHIISTAVDRVLKRDIGIFLVECAGRVVVHEDGARAEKAKIHAPIVGFVDPRLVEYLESEYGMYAVSKDDANMAVRYSWEEALNAHR